MTPRHTFRLLAIGPALLGLAGCAPEPDAPAVTVPNTDAVMAGQSTPTVYWNGVARELAQTYKVGQQPGTRGLAYLSLAAPGETA